jgi:Papain-like cysteine protease AvrRpt2
VSIALRTGTPIPLPGGVTSGGLLAEAGGGGGFASAVTLVTQEEDKWCWAACFQMIGQYVGVAMPSQHAMATAVFGAAACANRKSPKCNKGAFPLAEAHRFGLTCAERAGGVPVDVLQDYLRSGPVEVVFESMTPSGPRSHVAVVTSVSPSGTARVLDPWLKESFPDMRQLSFEHPFGPWVKSLISWDEA